MKKFFFTILLLLYVVSNIGATVQLHMCCGDVVDWSVKELSVQDSQHNSCCGDTAEDVEEECCQDRDINIKMEQPHIITSIDYLFSHHYNHSNHLYIDYSQFIVLNKDSDCHQTFPQPPPSRSSDIGLFILYKQMKISC